MPAVLTVAPGSPSRATDVAPHGAPDGGRHGALPGRLDRARSALLLAAAAARPADRLVAAHDAALQVAAVVLAVRGRSGPAAQRPRDPWRLVALVAPELTEWAAFFAAVRLKCDAVRAGASASVAAREADDLVRDVEAFIAVIGSALSRWERRWEGVRSATAAGGPEPQGEGAPLG